MTVIGLGPMGQAMTRALLDARDYPGGLANTAMMGAGAEHILETSRASGVDSTLPEAVASLYRRAIAAGHGARGWTVLSELVRPPECLLVGDDDR